MSGNPVESIPRPRGLTPTEARYVAALTENPDLSDLQALRKAGFGDSVCYNPSRVVTPELKAYAEHLRARAIEATLQEAYLDASEVLRELIRQYAGLIAQEARLLALLGHDFAELYDEAGAIKAPASWPEAWRKSLITEFEMRLEHGRPKDGDETAWSPVATITKVKRERPLDIERTLMACQREKRECLETIGKHVEVKAFPVPGDKLADAVGDLAGSIDRAIAEGRQRASQRNRLPINVTPVSE